MQPYLSIFGKSIPSYGFFITLGVICGNLIAIYVLRKNKLSFLDFIILEAYCFLGGFMGAKLLYFVTASNEIEWNRLGDLEYFNAIMKSGFVFYGGLIGGILFMFIFGKVHKIDSLTYIERFIFVLPYIHSFGRVGCFMAGCCYGRPYDGPGAVVYPEGSFAISGVKLFPVQIVEAIILLVISVVMLIIQIRRDAHYQLETYILLYSIARFVLEFFRYDEIRGIYWGLSTSQWISIVLLFVSVFLIYRKTIKRREMRLIQNINCNSVTR